MLVGEEGSVKDIIVKEGRIFLWEGYKDKIFLMRGRRISEGYHKGRKTVASSDSATRGSHHTGLGTASSTTTTTTTPRGDTKDTKDTT